MKAPDRIDVARQALGQVVTHPATWAPFVPVAAAYAFIGVPWWLCLPLLVAMLVIVFAVWARYWPQLMEKTRTEMLVNYRVKENVELGQRLNHLAQAAGRRPAAGVLDAMREAMDIKQAVENRLYADGVITTHEEEVGTTVGELVRTMVGEAERLMLAEGGGVTREASERFNKAAASLRRAYADIDVILDPVPENLRLSAADDALSRASERLDERLEQARGVRRHLERGQITPDIEPPANPPAPPSTVEN